MGMTVGGLKNLMIPVIFHPLCLNSAAVQLLDNCSMGLEGKPKSESRNTISHSELHQMCTWWFLLCFIKYFMCSYNYMKVPI